MEIIARNLPESVTRNQVEQFLRPYLFEVLIYAYHCRKLKNRTYAITVGDGQKAENFLERYNAKDGLQLRLEGQRVQCIRSDEKLDQFLLKSLLEEDPEKSTAISQAPQSLLKKYRAVRRKFNIESLVDNGPMTAMVILSSQRSSKNFAKRRCFLARGL